MTKPTFDMEAAIEALRAGRDLTGKDGILTPLIKQLTEAALNVELDQHLEDKQPGNRRNGKMIRTANTGHATKQHSLVRSFLD